VVVAAPKEVYCRNCGGWIIGQYRYTENEKPANYSEHLRLEDCITRLRMRIDQIEKLLEIPEPPE
jgi:hypothetical protein